MLLPTLSIQQYWAALVVLGLKPVENRTWHTAYRGPFDLERFKDFPQVLRKYANKGGRP